MRKIFKKALAGFTSVALVATLLVGMNVTSNVKADDAVALANWTFEQGGQYNPSEPGNEGYINTITMNGTNEVVNGWLRGAGSMNQIQTASQTSTGFALAIDNTGWDCMWSAVTGYETNRINPWSIQARMENVDVIPGHTYTVTFTARATKNKFGYVTFGCDVEGTTPYGEAPLEGDNPIITLGTTDKTFTYTFTNWVSASKLSTTLMLGAFDAQYDYAGNDISNIITAVENGWNGTVYVSNFSIVDNGEHEDWNDVKPPEPASTPEASTDAPTQNNPTVAPTTKAPATVAPTTPAPVVTKLGKVKKVKAVNNAAGKLKITWKKVANAKQYKVKVGKKTYKTKKAKLTVKKLAVGTYKIKVRALKTAGYKAGAWSATKKIKVTK